MNALKSIRSKVAAWNRRRLPPLHAAAAEGKRTAVARMLDQGTPIDQPDAWCRTALRHAVEQDQIDVAVEFLLRGANFQAPDRRGRLAIDPDQVNPVTLHKIRQRYKRSPREHRAPSTPQIDQWLTTLRRDGFMKLCGLVPPDALAEMRAGLSRWITQLDAKRNRGEADMKCYDEEEHWWNDDLAYVSNNAFAWSRELAKLCRRDDLVELASLYYGHAAKITRGVAMRYLPQHQRDNDMFGWHHDMEEKRFKLMILLTDLNANDQIMSYVLGSHVIEHSYEMFFHNSCTLDYCRGRIGEVRVRDTVGKAGDVFVFDSNGIHRGNRRIDATVRDAFFVEYDIDPSNAWGGDVLLDHSCQGEPSSPHGDPFEWFATSPKKWEQPITRTKPSWVENLPRVQSWCQTTKSTR